MNSELYTFIKEALEKNATKEQIQEVLFRAGWKEEEIQAALSRFANIPFVVAVPRPKPYLQAREAFLYLVSFILLYIAAFSFGSLLFAFVDHAFPDVVGGYMGSQGLQTPLAAIIVAFPLYLYMMKFLKSSEIKDIERQESGVKKWLSYITLVIVATVIIGDLVFILTNLLGGALSIVFILKAMSVLYIAFSIFWYYLWDLQRTEKKL